MPEYVQLRGSTYHFRRPVPPELRPIIGLTEITKSLRTKDRAEAGRLGRLQAVKTDEAFQEAEKLRHVLPVAAKKVPSQARADALSTGHTPAEVLAYAGVVATAFRGELQQAAVAGTLEAKREDLGSQLSRHEWNLRNGSIIDRFSLSVSESMIMGLRAALYGEGLADLASLPTLPPQNSSSDGPKLSDLIKGWAAQEQPTLKSIDMWKRTCAMFEEVVGAKAVGDYTRADVIAFRDHLVTLKRSPATVASRLSQIRTLLRYAVTQDIVPADISANVKAPAGKRAKARRLPFDLNALAALFSGPVHSRGERPRSGGGEAAYWLPLLALFTGARLNELGQLRVKDVTEETYLDARKRSVSAWTIRIVADESDGLTLKTEGSQRRIPVHPSLVDLGFLSFVGEARSSGQYLLFPDLVPDRYGTITGNWSKWFSRYLRTVCGVEDRLIVFHSFRHAFKHFARESGISKALNDEFTGHESGDVADTYGGLDYPLRPLVTAMASYRVLGLELPKAPSRIKAISR